jgi:hypothetical protein
MGFLASLGKRKKEKSLSDLHQDSYITQKQKVADNVSLQVERQEARESLRLAYFWKSSKDARRQRAGRESDR